MLDLRNPPRKRQWSRAPDRPLPVFAYKRIPLPTIQEPAVSPPRLPVEGKPVSDSKKSFKAGASRKKLAIPPVSRGSLKKKEQQAEKAGQAPRSTMARKALISAVQAFPKKADLGEELSPLSDSGESGDAPVASTSTLRAPQTPAKLPSFAKATQSSLAKTPGAMRSPVKASFGSPFKLARSTTLATRPANTYASQTEANSLLNQYYRKADELNSSMISHKPVVLRPPGVPRSVPALQRSVTHESVLCNKAGPSSARSNDANHVWKRMLTGRGKPSISEQGNMQGESEDASSGCTW
ncbi:hypothetical protein BDZ89DRAFT_737890 [Hymenopellis radicata]|nr:hypothetical protein BDZ89DRAFT_737890 [Hymenopellis radicata]